MGGSDRMPMRPCRHTIRIFYWQLETMPEYSSSVPTGTTPFKLWKRNQNHRLPSLGPNWLVGQYYPVPEHGFTGIRWFRVSYLEGPEPPDWDPPDWSNYQRYKRDKRANRT
jgi:hypothetical protein